MEKRTRYEEMILQLGGLLDGVDDQIARLANAAALIHTTFGFWWTGFYLVKGDALILGPFQGPVACTRIARGRGVCGTAWDRGETIVVPDVEQFPGHIACSSESRSEIVVPMRDASGNIIGVLDIDSAELATFDDVDREYLERAVEVILT